MNPSGSFVTSIVGNEIPIFLLPPACFFVGFLIRYDYKYTTLSHLLHPPFRFRKIQMLIPRCIISVSVLILAIGIGMPDSRAEIVVNPSVNGTNYIGAVVEPIVGGGTDQNNLQVTFVFSSFTETLYWSSGGNAIKGGVESAMFTDGWSLFADVQGATPKKVHLETRMKCLRSAMGSWTTVTNTGKPNLIRANWAAALG